MVEVDPNYEETAPVTLEGIAAVLAVVPALIGQASQKERQDALSDALGMLSRACAMAGGKSGPPSEVAVAALEQECSVALDEYAAFRVMGGEVKTLPERIRLLGDSWVRLKIAHEDVRRSLSESERRFSNEAAERMEEAAKTMGDTIRDRLLAILFPGSARPNLDLEGCLRDVDRLVRWTHGQKQDVRDAALEEAAATAASLIDERDSHAVCARADTIAKRIRALKSKPAPQPSENPGEFVVGGDARPAHLQTLKPCTCYRNAHPHVHIAHEGLTADECSRAGKALARAAGVKHVVVEPGGAKVAE